MLAVDFMQLFFNTVFYIKPYRIIASSFMNTLWVCLLTVKDSFFVFASTFIHEFAIQFPTVTRRDEQACVLFCCDEIEITRGLLRSFPSPCMHEERVMHLIFKSSLQEQHRPLSEGYFIVCWSNECSGYFKGGRYPSADESEINWSQSKFNLARANRERTEISRFFIAVFSLEICDLANVIINNSVAFDKTCFSYEQVREAVKDFSISFCLLPTVL